jgi:hypothetical protein
MKAIWKKQIEITDIQLIALPENSKILCVQTQNEKPCIWFLNENVESIKTTTHTFRIYGTGHPVDNEPGTYIGTFQIQGVLVFHLFEV